RRPPASTPFPYTTLFRSGFVRTLEDFRRLADRVSVSLNFHYADAAGNIAYFHRGTRPLHPFHTDPRLPLDGRGGMEWRGLVPPRSEEHTSELQSPDHLVC